MYSGQNSINLPALSIFCYNNIILPPTIRKLLFQNIFSSGKEEPSGQFASSAGIHFFPFGKNRKGKVIFDRGNNSSSNEERTEATLS